MRHHPDVRAAGERGVSLIEIMIYITVVAILGGPLIMVTLGMSRASAEGDMTSMVIERNRAALERMAGEIREALASSVTVPSDGMSVQFASTTGFDGVGPVAGPIIRYEIRTAPGETANWIDDDGDGLIDEASLVCISGGQEIVLTNALKSTGSSFWSGPSGVTINLVTSGRTRGDANPLDVTRTLTVAARN